MARRQHRTVAGVARADAPRGVAAVSPVGVLGDPTTATAAEGERIVAEMVDECVRRVARWGPASTGC